MVLTHKEIIYIQLICYGLCNHNGLQISFVRVLSATKIKVQFSQISACVVIVISVGVVMRFKSKTQATDRAWKNQRKYNHIEFQKGTPAWPLSANAQTPCESPMPNVHKLLRVDHPPNYKISFLGSNKTTAGPTKFRMPWPVHKAARDEAVWAPRFWVPRFWVAIDIETLDNAATILRPRRGRLTNPAKYSSVKGCVSQSFNKDIRKEMDKSCPVVSFASLQNPWVEC